MEKGYVKLSDAVAKLLTEENKDKNLGEVSEELNNYLIEIKDLVESNEISYDRLRDEIQKHIDSGENTRPGSVAQLLMGCVDQEECPLQKEKATDISFIYEHKTNKIIPLTTINAPVSEDSYCIIYINGDPETIKLESLIELEKMGFTKIKIKHKKPSGSEYNTIDIGDIHSMLNKKNGFDRKKTFIIAIFLVMLLLLYLYRN
jgi:hypothetical protein